MPDWPTAFGAPQEIAALILLIVFLLTERAVRQGGEARDISRGQHDAGSSVAIGVAYGLSITVVGLAPFFNALGLRRIALPDWVAWLGVALMVAGIALRVWANRVLGAYYTRTLRIQSGQSVVRAGPYRLIRHPGYAGALLMWLGAILATRNWITLVVVGVSVAGVYLYRISTEERMLATELEVTTRRIWRTRSASSPGYGNALLTTASRGCRARGIRKH
jgi:protein-S-isoprenylcysteine O-methyltransferase Ste14